LIKIKKYLKFIIPVVSLILVGLGYYFLFMLPSREERLQADDLVETAEDFVSQKHFAEAVEKYREAEDLDPGNHRIYIGIGNIYLQKNRESDAIEVLQVGVNKARSDSEVNQLLGKIYLDNGDYSRAIFFFDNAIKSDKDNEEAKYLMAVAKVGAGNISDAKEYLDISQDDYNLYAKAKLLEAMLEKDDVNSAEDLLDDLDRSDLDENIADQIDFYLDVIDQIDDTEKEFKTDVYVAVMVSRGALFSGFEDLVISMLSEYEEEYDLYWELNLYLGHAYLLKDNYDKALEYLQQAYSLNPVDYKGTWLLARAYLGADNDTEMVAYYDKAILLADDQEELDVRREYFDVLLSEQQYARAEEQLDEIIAGDEDESYYYNIVWADSLLDRGLNNKVEEQLNVLDFDEISNSLKPEYYYLQAGVEYGNADWDKALASIESSIELDDNLAKYRLMKGLILYELGRDEEAESELERAIDLDLVGDVSAEAVKTLDRI
jgi:tetratricopeptide (TPR) repeat protein